jgi:hypothetical protein
MTMRDKIAKKSVKPEAHRHRPRGRPASDDAGFTSSLLVPLIDPILASRVTVSDGSFVTISVIQLNYFSDVTTGGA